MNRPIERRIFLAGLSTAALSVYTQRTPTHAAESDIILGHGDHRYRLIRDWVDPNQAFRFPILNCHEMARSRDGRLFMVGDHSERQVVVFNQQGRILDTWAKGWPGGHGVEVVDEGDEEFLLIADCGVWKVGTTYYFQTGSVTKARLDGQVVFTISHPAAHGAYTPDMKFNPTETAIAPNGDIFVADGYGSSYILRYDANGKFISKFGATDGPVEGHLHTPHGLIVDKRDGVENATLLVNSRLDQCFRRFTMDGKYLETISLPGAYCHRPVIVGDYLYTAVCWSQKPDAPKLGGLEGINWNPSGFVLVLDKNNRVVSAPGGVDFKYVHGKLQPMTSLTPAPIHHAHDVHVLENGDILVMQWNAEQTYPLRLELIA